ncbi:two-component system response regulator YcbB [Anaerospora hongkongensis]|uniref:Two-component system response regulator YcbB n=1 Tax=Anaerospora hongkongensis TaxID=244830 RepID=A0A4R1PSI3_9FIRM|nr:response regulator [Anaerospora hongkongensis]TCL33613.1 two-component system response regulator YcbB [Anaerospora hongkongensis]
MELRLAIVDDDITVRKILARIISEAAAGVVAVECGDGLEAQRILQDNPVDIALIDMLLPGQDGVELIKTLRTQTLTTSFIMISQVKNEPMITRAYESGIEFFIHKPINALEVVSVINRVKESRKLRQFMSLIYQATSHYSTLGDAPPQTGEGKHKAAVYRTFSDLGIIGETGANDIFLMTELIAANQRQGNEASYQLNELYGQLSQRQGLDAKTIEQRIRRAISKALQNLANLGAEDYYNEKFQNYSTSLFDFKEVRQEMSFINGKSNYRGKINVKKFIEGIMFAAKHTN